MARGMYILDENGDPVLERDRDKWSEWFETANLHVADETHGGVRVSTVFLGQDHSHGGGPPLLFETMIFGGDHDGYQERTRNRFAALSCHDQAVAMVLDSLGDRSEGLE